MVGRITTIPLCSAGPGYNLFFSEKAIQRQLVWPEMLGKMVYLKYLLILNLLNIKCSKGQTINFLLVAESAQPSLTTKFTNGLKIVQDSNPGSLFEVTTINFTRKYAEDAYQDMCNR